MVYSLVPPECPPPVFSGLAERTPAPDLSQTWSPSPSHSAAPAAAAHMFTPYHDAHNDQVRHTEHHPLPATAPTYSDATVANHNVWDFGWEFAHGAVSRRPPIPLDTMVARTHMCTYAAKVWDLSIVLSPRAKP
jgi:hypothetical protein